MDDSQDRDPKARDAKLIEININTKDFKEPKGSITYDRVIALAFPDFAQFPNATYSIVYDKGPDSSGGTLSKGGSVKIVKGMRFRAKRTGES